MVHILEALQRLESKFDNLAISSISPPGSNREWNPPGNESRSLSAGVSLDTSLAGGSGSSDTEARAEARIGAQQSFPRELQRSYQHLTVAHKVLLWPSIYLHILNSGVAAGADLQYILQDGTPWFIHLELAKHPETLPWNTEMTTYPIPQARTGEIRTGFASLTPDNIQRMTDAYFGSFNLLFPILDRDSFMSDVVAPVMRNGYSDGDPAACLALLVFALGQVAIDGVYGAPINNANGGPSGLRGGTAERPPGLDLFNEARRRLGFMMHQCTLENVQILLLEAQVYHLWLLFPMLTERYQNLL
ncbi:hypothetical protein MBLNU459_g7748t1 [Dothideomycetes sp. NU459]